MPAEMRDAVGLDDLLQAVDHEVRREYRRERSARDVRDEQARSARNRRARWLTIVSSCAVLAALGANLAHIGTLATGDRRLSAEMTGREIEKALQFGVRLVESHRSVKGALPADLAAVGLAAAAGWSYQAAGAADYRLSLSFGGQQGVFDSSTGSLVVVAGKGRQ